MPRMKLTALSVARLNPPPSGQVDYFDSAFPAFGVRLSVAGARTYFVMTRVQGKLARLTIGKAKINDDDPGLSLRDAREKAGELSDLAARGIDPRQLKQEERAANQERARNTFRGVAERFMEQYVEPRLAVSTHREYRRTLFGDDTSRWAKRPIAGITRADVARGARCDGCTRERGCRQPHACLFEQVLQLVRGEGPFEVPPTDRIKPPGVKNVGERTLNEAEIGEVWRAFEAEGGFFGDIFKLLLLTGQRRSEVGGMRRSELNGFDGDGPAWKFPALGRKTSVRIWCRSFLRRSRSLRRYREWGRATSCSPPPD